MSTEYTEIELTREQENLLSRNSGEWFDFVCALFEMLKMERPRRLDLPVSIGIKLTERIAALEHRAGYAMHKPECEVERYWRSRAAWHGNEPPKCTCGLDEVQKG